MAPKSNCASTPCRLLRYWNAGAVNPCAISGRAAPSRSSMSSVGGWKVEARDSSLRSGPASNTVTGTPPRTRLAAATRPTGPAPAINTRSSIGMMLGARSSPGQAFAGKRHRALELVLTRHELAAQELADGRFRYRLDEDVAPRPLEIGEPRGAAELIELLGLDHAAALDEGGNDLAPALVRDPDHGHLGDRGMQRQAAFDLDRRDVLAAADDHVVDAAGDEEIAVDVEISGVAGEIPAAAQCLGVRVRAPPIALEGLVALKQSNDLALFPGGGDLVRRGGAEPHHAHHLVDARATGRARLRRRILVDGEGVDFGRAVVIDEQLRLEGGAEALEQAVRHRRPREAELAHRAHIRRREPLVVQQVMIERRHEVEVGDALGRDQFERARNVETRQADEGAADQRHGQQ